MIQKLTSVPAAFKKVSHTLVPFSCMQAVKAWRLITLLKPAFFQMILPEYSKTDWLQHLHENHGFRATRKNVEGAMGRTAIVLATV